MVFLQAEFGHWNGHSQFPAFTLSVESGTQFLYEKQVVVNVGVSSTAIRCSGIFPIEIKAIGYVGVQKNYKSLKFQIQDVFT